MTNADFVTLLLKAPATWYQGARLYLLTDTIRVDTTKCAPTYTGLSAKIKNIPTQEVWLHTPQPVTATEDVTIYYDKVIPAGRFIENGAIKPDIVVWDRKARSALIIDVSVPKDFGINRAERDKVTKYQGLKNALKDEWKLNEISVIPVIVGATGIMKDNLESYLDNIPG